MQLNDLIKETNYCTHESLTNNYAWHVQIAITIAAFSSLLVKRFCERKNCRRSWKIWIFDLTRIAFGFIMVQIISGFFAIKIDPCTLYLTGFILDTSVGLLILYLFVRLVLFVAIKYDIQTLLFGFYGSPSPKAIFWLHQTFAFFIILLVQKFIIYYILWLKASAWNQVGDLILYLIDRNGNFELAIILLLMHFFVNVFIFWIADDFRMCQCSIKLIDFDFASKMAIKGLQSLTNCISNSVKLIKMYDIMFINTKQELRNEEDDNLVEINLETINSQPA